MLKALHFGINSCSVSSGHYTSPFQIIIWPGSARKGVAGPELGIAPRISCLLADR